MAVSNNRVKERNTVHHLISRIAHRVYFLKDEECQDFLSMMFRVAEFSGIRLLGWCIMTNHFHILAYLPEEEELDEVEIVRRYGVLKGKMAAGYDMAMDPLTDEAMVAQAAAHIKKVISASMELKAVEKSRRESQRAELEGKSQKRWRRTRH